MNQIPVVFNERVLHHFAREQTLLVCTELTKPLGAIASRALKNCVYRAISVMSGQCVYNQLHVYYNLTEREIRVDTTCKKYLQHTTIYFHPNDCEYEADAGLKRRISACIKDSSVNVSLETAILNKETVDLMTSMPVVSELIVKIALTDEICKIVAQLVQKKTLNYVQFNEDHTPSAEGTQLILDLLQQDQFCVAELMREGDLPLTRLIDGWKESSGAMAGKRVHCFKRFGVQQAAEFGFRECTAEETTYLEVYQPQVEAVRGKPSKTFILRKENGERMYALTFESAAQNDNCFIIYAFA